MCSHVRLAMPDSVIPVTLTTDSRLDRPSDLTMLPVSGPAIMKKGAAAARISFVLIKVTDATRSIGNRSRILASQLGTTLPDIRS